MPNTLAHLGVQGLITRGLLHYSDLKWIYVGCIIPDFPWILQRIVSVVLPGINPYELRLYAIVQASLFFCLILSTALAIFSVNILRTFAVLSLGSTLHLLIDALQTKWGNGVHLFAPFNWELINFRLFWPEEYPTFILTGFGLLYFLFYWRRALHEPSGITIRDRKRLWTVGGILAVYFTAPILMSTYADSSDSHYVRTLREIDLRAGRYIEIDRASYHPTDTGGQLKFYAGEFLDVEGIELDQPVTVSIRGRFITQKRVLVDEWHFHPQGIRNYASHAGLFLVISVWVASAITVRRRVTNG